MVCPKCNGQLKTTITMPVSMNEIFRLKKCIDCGRLVYTAEFEVEPNARFRKEWNEYAAERKSKNKD